MADYKWPQVSSGGGGSAAWGDITGTLADQTDLQAALDGKLGTTLTSARIFVGNGSNVATGVAVTGDVTISNAGVTAIGSGVIVNADVNASAAIAVSKLAALTASRAVVSDGSGFLSAATTTATEIGYVNGVTSAIQTQLNAKAPTASPAFTTQVTFGNYHLEPSEVDDGNSSTADTIDWSAGSAHKSTLTGNCTYTFSNPVTGGSYILRVLTGAGGFTVTWPASVKWAGGSAPTVTSTASRMDLFNFYYDGTNYYGSYTQNYTP